MRGMLAALRKCWFPLLLVAFHALALAIIVFFQIRWPWLVRSAAAEVILSAALLIFGGAAGPLGGASLLPADRSLAGDRRLHGLLVRRLL